jgi:WD40 repeat protein
VVVCVSCNGDGDLRCETCDEQGKVREYKLLNVVFEYQSNSETIGALEIPDEKLQQVAGVEIFQTEEDTITSLHGINDPRLTNHALEFLAQFNPSSSIMLYQELTITRIPVFKVAYKKHFAGKQKVLWIYGNEHQVYFEGQSSFSRKASKREVATGSFKSLALLTLLFLLTASQIYGYVRYGFFPSSPVFVITSLPSSIFLKTTLTKTTDADVTGVAISSDGQTLVSGDLAGFITVWNLETGELKRTINTTQAVWSIALTPDDQTVVSGNDDGTIGLWNLETSELKRTLTGHSNSVAYLAITPDGQTLASAGNMGDKSDKTVKVWNLETGELKRTLRGHEYWLLSIAISPDGQTVASSSSDNTIRLWSLDTGEQKNIFYMKNTGVLGNRDVANAIVFSPDGKNLLANMSTYGNIELWNLNTGKQKNIFLDTNNKTQHNTSNIVISPDGQTLVGGSGYGTLMVWNLNKGELKNTLKGHIHSISNLTLSPDGRTLVSGGYDGTIKIWRVP